ncbi:DUF1345 domain-containing protein [Herbiconiux sp.]|uniref:DUF1345 domain-containing protein n=1 Tax=Herbiconiux sp. TaxID=1871186 RepID=UPI0025BC6F0E|nr:DUF1345 domain-containing protein [Herbiconiux sp.]
MIRRKPTTAFFRLWFSSLIATLVTLMVQAVLVFVADVDPEDVPRLVVAAYVVAWPVYTALYVGWSIRVYNRLDRDPASLRSMAVADEDGEKRTLARNIAGAGSTSVTISAAAVAVIVTVTIAQQPDFRGDPVYIGLALLTVASSWVLMVFSFAQRYLRLGSITEGAHFRFHFSERPRFTDYLTLAVLLSVMAATTSAEITSRAGWLSVRTNVIIAFVFNSVIIAMMVALIFGALLA